MRSIIITIGDELLIGQVINTNAAFIAEKLNSVGIEVARMVTVADEEEDILTCLRDSTNKFEVIVVTGGLGPTHDDITRSAVCKFFGTELVSSAEARTSIEKFLASRKREWSEAAEDQTRIPRGARIIPNHHGTAPGEFFESDNKFVIVMPGVPYEMETMMNEFVVPFFQNKKTGKVILHRTLKTSGIPESVLAGKLGNIEELLDGAKLAFLPSPSGVRMRITVTGSQRDECNRHLQEIEQRIRARTEKFIYGSNDEELEAVLGTLLRERHLRLAVAESCTGGTIAHKLTSVPGSSDYFDRAVIAYSNQSKINLLQVPKKLIEEHGAVSKEVAEAMARGIRELSNVDIGISTTGIAGPTGGSEEKPVGLVWIGYSDPNETIALKFHLGDERNRIIDRASQSALELLRRKLLKIE